MAGFLGWLEAEAYTLFVLKDLDIDRCERLVMDDMQTISFQNILIMKETS